MRLGSRAFQYLTNLVMQTAIKVSYSYASLLFLIRVGVALHKCCLLLDMDGFGLMDFYHYIIFDFYGCWFHGLHYTIFPLARNPYMNKANDLSR